MGQSQTLNATAVGRGNLIGRVAAFLYGIAAYAVFFITFLYAVGFVEGMVVPKTIDSGIPGPPAQTLIINLVQIGRAHV